MVTDNVKRIRRDMAESMRNRNRIDDDSDLEQLVYERMSNNDGEFVELDLGCKGHERQET